jgi:hypothetical protein
MAAGENAIDDGTPNAFTAEDTDEDDEKAPTRA